MSHPQVRIALWATIMLLAILGWQVVSDGGLATWDESVALSLSQSVCGEARTLAELVSQLGHPVVVGITTLVALGGFLAKRNWRAALAVVVAVLGAGITSQVIKTLVDRPRPDVGLDVVVSGASFPSATTVLAAVVFGSYAAWVVPRIGSATARHALSALCLAIPLAVAASRVAVSEHYVTDVVAALAIGAFWVLLTLMVLKPASSNDCKPDLS